MASKPSAFRWLFLAPSKGIAPETAAGRKRVHVLLVLMVAIQAVLLGWSSFAKSPTNDEFGHFFAGVQYWKFGRLDVFNVNPPLVRAYATLPAILMGEHADEAPELRQRLEFREGRRRYLRSPSSFKERLVVGRLVNSVFALLGTLLVFQYARTLACEWSGIFAAGLWAFQPQILAHGSLITSDVANAVAICFACYRLDVLIRNPAGFRSILLLAVGLGFSALTKFTGLLAFIPATYAFFQSLLAKRMLALRLGIAVSLSILLIASAYSFCGWPFLAGNWNPLSKLAGSVVDWLPSGLPIPLPMEFVAGLDRQQVEFERGMPSFAAGKHGDRGWWWFYLYSMVVKLPVGTLLILLATTLVLAAPAGSEVRKKLGYVVAFGCLIILSTAIKSGFSQQHRYIFSVYPFAFILSGLAFSVCRSQVKILLPLFYIGLVLTLVETSSVAPRWLSSFNLIGGGNTRGFTTLYNDASDWGQEADLVARWIENTSSKDEIYVFSTVIGGKILRKLSNTDFIEILDEDGLKVALGKESGWLVVSKTSYVSTPETLGILERQKPYKYLGGTHIVYRLTDAR